MAMSDIAALALVHSDGLFVSAGERPMPKGYRGKRVIFWVASRQPIDTPRGCGHTIGDAVADMLAEEKAEAQDSDDDLL